MYWIPTCFRFLENNTQSEEKLTKSFEPNFILFSGEHGREKFKKINYLKSNNLLCFGSNRRIKVKIKKLAVEQKREIHF